MRYFDDQFLDTLEEGDKVTGEGLDWGVKGMGPCEEMDRDAGGGVVAVLPCTRLSISTREPWK